MEKDVEKSYYERVKNYVVLKPESTKVQVSAFTGIPIDFIEDGIASGKFVEGLRQGVEPLNVEKYKEPESQLVVDLQKKYGIGNKDNDWNR